MAGSARHLPGGGKGEGAYSALWAEYDFVSLNDSIDAL